MGALYVEGLAIRGGPRHVLPLERVVAKRWMWGTCRPGLLKLSPNGWCKRRVGLLRGPPCVAVIASTS